MINQAITNIQIDLSKILNESQMKALQESLVKHLPAITAEKSSEEAAKEMNILPLFIAAKRMEGCSEKSLRYYNSTIRLKP